ncbi:MAG: GNAT family N-acetyltransferase [Actinobacteria bacterium]|nr:GNAT family N-acetyltransferase [Actinomycetota bacterium]
MARPLTPRDRTTRRLVLHPFRRRDAEPLVAAVHDSIEDLARWLPWAHQGYGRSDAIRFIRDSTAAWTEGRAYDFAIEPATRPKSHLGNVSVWHTSRREQAGEIGYWIRSTLTGTGIGTEAAARVMQVAFEELELHRVTLRIATGNTASERIAEKLGFVREGLLRKEVLVAGHWLDHSLWAILDEEFRANCSRYAAEGWIGDRR